MKQLIIAAALLAASFTEAKDTVKLLTVGNSFAGNSIKYLDRIATDAGCRVVFGRANPGGCSLERHWNYAAAHEADPADPAGKPYNGRSLKELLESDRWDVVTIQQYSAISDDIETYRPYAKNLYDYIKKYAPQAEVMIHQTWAYRADDTGKYRNGYDQAAMQKKVRENYHAIAKDLGIRIIPVGEAFANARNHPDWKFEKDPDFDYKNPAYPVLPNEKQSLNKGFNWANDKKWSVDTHHASPLGEYLGGAVFFEMLFDKSIAGNSFRPPAASEEDILFLQQIAHDTVADGKNTSANP